VHNYRFTARRQLRAEVPSLFSPTDSSGQCVKRPNFPAEASGDPVVIFDCNDVLVDSEPLATAIVSQESVRAGFPLTPDMIARYFTGRRPADMFADVEFATGRTDRIRCERR
jgi:hypothetical protein